MRKNEKEVLKERILKRMKKYAIKYRELSEKTGLSQSGIHYYLHGNRPVDVSTLKKINESIREIVTSR